MSYLQTFAETTHAATEPAGGLSALGINGKAFLFQLITFVLLLLVLRKFAYPTLVKTLEERRVAVEQSLDQAKEAAEALAKAEEKIAAQLKEARTQADSIIEASQKEANQLLEAAETKAVKRAETIVADAKSQMDVEIRKARNELRDEAVQLVAAATEQIIRQKVDAKQSAAAVQAVTNKPAATAVREKA